MRIIQDDAIPVAQQEGLSVAETRGALDGLRALCLHSRLPAMPDSPADIAYLLVYARLAELQYAQG